MGLRFDLDPSLPKVVAIAILLCIETCLGLVISHVSAGEMPTEIEWLTIVCVALLQLATFLSAFLRTGEMPEKEVKE